MTSTLNQLRTCSWPWMHQLSKANIPQRLPRFIGDLNLYAHAFNDTNCCCKKGNFTVYSQSKRSWNSPTLFNLIFVPYVNLINSKFQATYAHRLCNAWLPSSNEIPDFTQVHDAGCHCSRDQGPKELVPPPENNANGWNLQVFSHLLEICYTARVQTCVRSLIKYEDFIYSLQKRVFNDGSVLNLWCKLVLGRLPACTRRII